MLTKLRARTAEESGFTLVELLIVIAILGVLAGVVVFSVAGITDDGQTAACQTEASTVRAAQEAHYAKTKPHVYATTFAGLTTGANKLLGTSPTLVELGSGSSTSAYTLEWVAGGDCVGVTGP